jgi:hypothetical protein
MELNFFFYVSIVFVEEETTELKQLVCKRGSILLGELIAIKIVLEYIDQPEIRRKINILVVICLLVSHGIEILLLCF